MTRQELESMSRVFLDELSANHPEWSAYDLAYQVSSLMSIWIQCALDTIGILQPEKDALDIFEALSAAVDVKLKEIFNEEENHHGS